MDLAAKRPQEIAERIRSLVAACEKAQPPFSSLGTPYVGLDETSQEIIGLGTQAVDPLVHLLPHASPHAAACIAFCLGQIGDRRAIRPLEQALARCEARAEKDAYDFAFIGNARAALEQIGR